MALVRQAAVLRVKTITKWRATTDSRHVWPVAPNTLARQFTVDRPNRVRASDLTYVRTTEGWLNLAVVLDQLLATHGITASMSLRGHCWDNACAESFFGTLKRDLIHHRRYATRQEAMQDISEYIEASYNRQQRLSTLGLFPSTVRGNGESRLTRCPRKWGKFIPGRASFVSEEAKP